jgi:WD40 repeat protein
MRKNNQLTPQSARPTYEITLNDKVVCFESSTPSIHGDSILIVALLRRIIVFALDLGIGEDYNFDQRIIKEIAEADTKIIRLCSQVIARNIFFATCCNNSIKVFSVNESEVDCLQQIDAHTSYINSIDFCDEYIASGSDDHTCKIFSVKDNYDEHSVLQFSAPVTCVRFNPEELNKVLISVKNGNLFVYCLKLKQSLYSFYTYSPLLYFDWSVKNPCIVAALANEQIFYFDISKPE